MPQSALEKLDYLIVNGLEARQLAAMLGLKTDHNEETLAQALSRAGNLTCIVTRSEKGAVACSKDGEIITVPAIQLEKVIDTTGAGDAYCGTFAAAIYAKKPLRQAMRLASVAGTLACTGKGAQESFAYQGDIEDALENLPE